MKAFVFLVTGACAFALAFRESKLKRALVEGALRTDPAVSDIGFINDLKGRFADERFLRQLPHPEKKKLRWLSGMKLVAVAALVAEVICL